MRTFDEAAQVLNLTKLPRPFTFKKPVTFPRSQDTVPAGATVDLYYSEKCGDRVYFEYGSPTAKTIRLSRCHLYFKGFIKPPSPATLQKWDDMGMCRTPLGEATEPDGHDRFGMPSWLMVYGLI